MLSVVPGAAAKVLQNLIDNEVANNERRSLETDTLRSDSVAMRVLSLVIHSGNVSSFQHQVASAVLACVEATIGSEEAAFLSTCLATTVNIIASSLVSAPPEVLLLLQCTRKAAIRASSVDSLEGVATHLERLHVSFFCLRIICPSLVEQSLCHTTALVQSRMLLLAKTLQLIANNIVPAPHTPSFLLHEQMATLGAVLFDQCTAGSMRPFILPRPGDCLLVPAVALYGIIESLVQPGPSSPLTLGPAPSLKEVEVGFVPPAVKRMQQRCKDWL